MDNLHKLTDIQLVTLEHMNEGAYLIKNDKAEGITFNQSSTIIQTRIEAGTIAALLDKGLVRRHLAVKKKYLLTDTGRQYKKVK